MVISRKALLATLAGATLLSGCATYYDPYGGGYGYGDRYGYAPGYYDPYYVAPSVTLGYTYYERDGRRYYRDRDGREWRHNDRVRDGRQLEREVREGRRDPEGRVMESPTGGDLGTGRDPRANPNNSPG